MGLICIKTAAKSAATPKKVRILEVVSALFFHVVFSVEKQPSEHTLRVCSHARPSERKISDQNFHGNSAEELRACAKNSGAFLPWFYSRF